MHTRTHIRIYTHRLRPVETHTHGQLPTSNITYSQTHRSAARIRVHRHACAHTYMCRGMHRRICTAMGRYYIYKKPPKLAFMPTEMHVHIINARIVSPVGEGLGQGS